MRAQESHRMARKCQDENERKKRQVTVSATDEEIKEHLLIIRHRDSRNSSIISHINRLEIEEIQQS